MYQTDIGGSGNGRIEEDVQGDAKEKLHRLHTWSEHVLDRVESFVRERPGTAMLCAIGVGFLVGRVVRR